MGPRALAAHSGETQSGAVAGPTDPDSRARTIDSEADDGVDLYWIPLGAGGHFVKWNGRVYEAIAALHEHRRARSLYHSALEVHLDGVRYAVEMAPVWQERTAVRGVVREGPVGARWLGRFRAFRYEVRCWPDGRIPDIAEALAGPHRVSATSGQAAALLAILRTVPVFTWGRDEVHTGDMWNSNSVVSWALARTGHDMAAVTPPHGGRAPGWLAGLALAGQQAAGGVSMTTSSSA